MTNNGGKLLSIIIAVVVAAGVLFFALQYFSGRTGEMAWTADESRESISRKVVKLERPGMVSDQDAAGPALDDPADARITEVFGRIPSGLADREKPDCRELEQDIRSFFTYLDNGEAMTRRQDAASSYDTFRKMITDLSNNTPTVAGETRDMINLLHNQAHFFRALDKERVELVAGILKTEQDILEPAMAVFYSYYACGECCEGKNHEKIPADVLYSYAGFFLDTLSGKSYLMRRSSAMRSLTLYYSVMVLDQANDTGANSFGIDIRPHIDLATDDIGSRNNLLYKDRYMEDLAELKKKYEKKTAAN